MKKIIVIGGVAGGASFSARMRRLDESAQIVMFDKGEYISFANCGLPYYIGDAIKNRGDLFLQTPQRFNARFRVDVRTKSEVTAVDTAAKQVTVTTPDRVYTESYDYLLLAPGCKPVLPSLPGIGSPLVHTLRTIPDADLIRAMLDNCDGREAVVIGGGFIGLEMAEALHRRGLDVTIIEMTDQVFAPADREMAAILHAHLRQNGIKLLLGNGVKEIADNGPGKASVVLVDGGTVNAGMILLAIGVKPDTGFLRNSGIALSERGAIIVDDRLKTSCADVYAAGDAVEVIDLVSGKKTLVPLAGPANRQGRIAADNIAGIASTYKNTQGTAICKVFDMAASATGMNEKTARRLGIPFVKSYTHSASHASYYPGSTTLSTKLLFSPETGKLLGAQIIGGDGVDKRIDVLAAALRHGLSVHDLAELELAYAPPYGSAKDPVNVAGFVAQNILAGIMPVFYGEEIGSIEPAGQQLLDVRTKGEYQQGSIPDSINIPLDTLRQRLNELDKVKEQMVYCQVGLRGHLATRILLQNGFKARNLSGGYATWTALQMGV